MSSLPTETLLDLLAGVARANTTLKPWGGEVGLDSEEGDMQVKYIVYDELQRTSLQVHMLKEELLLVVWMGNHGKMEVGDESFVPRVGQVVRVRAGTPHRVTGAMKCVELSTYAPDDVVRLEDDYGRAVQ